MKSVICCWWHMLSHLKQNRLKLDFLTPNVPIISMEVEACSQTWMRVLFIQLSWETIVEWIWLEREALSYFWMGSLMLFMRCLELKNNLLNIGQLQEKGLTILIQGVCKIYHPLKGLIIQTKMSINKMFILLSHTPVSPNASPERCYYTSTHDFFFSLASKI